MVELKFGFVGRGGGGGVPQACQDRLRLNIQVALSVGGLIITFSQAAVSFCLCLLFNLDGSLVRSGQQVN